MNFAGSTIYFKLQAFARKQGLVGATSSPVEPRRSDNLLIDVRDDVVVATNRNDGGCGRGVRFAAMSQASIMKNTP
jgi:hypothetical protein